MNVISTLLPIRPDLILKSLHKSFSGFISSTPYQSRRRFFLPVLLCISPVALGSELQLSGERSLKTELQEAKLISELRGYAIIAGRSCIDCDENTAIYLKKIRTGSWGGGNPDNPQGQEEMAEAGLASDNIESERFTYPGKYADYESNKLVEKTRMFYGQCYENESALLWLSEYLSDSGWVKSEYLIVFGENGLEHRYNEDRQPSVFYIENKNCVELPGITAKTEP